jgi:hypothetical protein
MASHNLKDYDDNGKFKDFFEKKYSDYIKNFYNSDDEDTYKKLLNVISNKAIY